MRHRLPAVLVALVVLTALTTGVSAGLTAAQSAGPTDPGDPAASTPVVNVRNTTGYLALPSGQQATHHERFGTATVDVAGATAMDSSQFSIRLVRQTTFEAFRSAPNTTARTRLLRDAAASLENRSRALREQQSAALRAYNSGRISTRTVLRRLAIIDARARRLDAAIDELLEDVSTEPDYTLPTDLRVRLQNVQTGPKIVAGPVKTAIGESIVGTGPRQAYIGITGESMVLARTVGGRYVREAFVASAYDGAGADQFRNARQDPISAAYERARALYPWAFANRISVSARGFGVTPVYRFTVDHSHGQLISYLDGRTNQTFREIQNKRLSRLPIDRTVTRGDENLTIRANLTHATGPMQVAVRDPALNETVNAQIRIDGTPVGRTGDDGSLWTIRPTGLTTINATTADHSVEITLGV